MITKTSGFADSKGNVHADLVTAQRAEIRELLGKHKLDRDVADVAAKVIAENSTAVAAILKEPGRTRAKRTRKSKSEKTANPAPAPEAAPAHATEAEPQLIGTSTT